MAAIKVPVIKDYGFWFEFKFLYLWYLGTQTIHVTNSPGFWASDFLSKNFMFEDFKTLS